MKYNYYLAQAYGSCAYGEGSFDGQSTCTTTGSGSGTSTGAGGATGTDGLANTGILVILIVSVACFLIFLALVARFVHRKKKTKQAVVLPTDLAQPSVDQPAAPQPAQPVDSQSPIQPTQAPVQNDTPPQPPKRIDF